MAVDTRDKRGSCIGLASPWRSVLPNPDAAAEDQGDRQQLAYSYRGILAGVLTYPDAEIWDRVNFLDPVDYAAFLDPVDRAEFY